MVSCVFLMKLISDKLSAFKRFVEGIAGSVFGGGWR